MDVPKIQIGLFTLADILHELGEDGAHCFDAPEDRVAIAERFAFELGLDLYDLHATQEFVRAATLPGDIDFAADEETYDEETEGNNVE